MFTCLDHVGIVVEDLDEAIALYRDRLGFGEPYLETIEEQGVEIALFDVGPNHIELLRPLSPDNGPGRFLAKRGPGVHHMAYRVDDVDSALKELVAAGFELIDTEPRTGVRNSRIAFLHPRSTGGILTEITQPPAGH